MPVGLGSRGKMVFQPATQSTRTKGAADIQIPPGREVESAKSANCQMSKHGKVQNEDIRTFFESSDNSIPSTGVQLHGHSV